MLTLSFYFENHHMLDSLSPASDHCGTVNWLVSLAGLFRKTLVYCSTNKLDSLVSFFSGARVQSVHS